MLLADLALDKAFEASSVLYSYELRMTLEPDHV
jgi:hypothetical protein